MEKNNEHIGNSQEQESEVRRIEDEMRKLAIPYISEEPGPLYWANFRVRVMERVAQNEQKTAWFERIQQFIAGHIWGSSIAVSAAALLVAGIMMYQPFEGSHPSSAISSPRLAVAPPAVSTPLEKPEPAIIPEQSKKHEANRQHESFASQHQIASASDLASVAEPIATPDDDHPVSLEELSKPELEAVLQGLQNNNEQEIQNNE